MPLARAVLLPLTHNHNVGWSQIGYAFPEDSKRRRGFDEEDELEAKSIMCNLSLRVQAVAVPVDPDADSGTSTDLNFTWEQPRTLRRMPRLEVMHCNSEAPEYLILKHRFDRALHTIWRPGDKFQAPFWEAVDSRSSSSSASSSAGAGAGTAGVERVEEGRRFRLQYYTGTVLGVSCMDSTDWPHSPWDAVVVDYDTCPAEDEPFRLCPWELDEPLPTPASGAPLVDLSSEHHPGIHPSGMRLCMQCHSWGCTLTHSCGGWLQCWRRCWRPCRA